MILRLRNVDTWFRGETGHSSEPAHPHWRRERKTMSENALAVPWERKWRLSRFGLGLCSTVFGSQMAGESWAVLLKQGDDKIVVQHHFYIMAFTIWWTSTPPLSAAQASLILCGFVFFFLYTLTIPHANLYSCSYHTTLYSIQPPICPFNHPLFYKHLLHVSPGPGTVLSTEVVQLVHSYIPSTRLRVLWPFFKIHVYILGA